LNAITTSSESLKQLVELASQTQAQNLNELAGILTGMKQETQTLADQEDLKRLAQAVDSLQSHTQATQQSVKTMAKILPEIKQAQQESQEAGHAQVDQQLAAMQEQIDSLVASLQETSESILKTMFVTKENLQGVAVELKSALTSSQEATADQLQSLQKSLSNLGSSIQEIEKRTDTTASAMGSASSLSSKALKKHNESISKLVDDMTTLRADLENHVEAALSDGQPTQDALTSKTDVNQVIRQINEIAQQIHDQMDALNQDIIQLADAQSAGGEQESTDESPSETSSTVHPEERGDEALGVSLY
jgi:DNA repair exonuclease SbcCD ATPase subunit